MDKPCSAPNPVATFRVEELIRELKTKYTVHNVTHNMQQVIRLSNMPAFFKTDAQGVGRLVKFNQTALILINSQIHQLRHILMANFRNRKF